MSIGRFITRGPSKRLLLCIAAIGLAFPVVVPAAAAAAEGPSGFVTHGEVQVQVSEVDGVRFFEATESVTARPQRPGAATKASLIGSGPGYRVQYKNVLSANNGRARWVSHYYAETKRLSGWGPYRAEAHATLIEGASYEGEQRFSGYTHRCATVNRVNATAKTCASPRFDTSPGDYWYVISGHSYDHGNDGTVERIIAGELDYLWQAPSS